MICNKPDGTPYCNFSVDEELFTISFLEGSNLKGLSVDMSRKILPTLKKFLESLEPVEEKTVVSESVSEKLLKCKEQKGRDLREALEKFSKDYFSDKEYEVGDLEAGEKFSLERNSRRK
jgi:hypothetical protein